MDNPTKATLLYDGDCGFCSHWVERWYKITGEVVEYAPYQTHGHHFPQVTQEAARQAVQLAIPNGRVYSAAEAVFKALALSGKHRYLLWLYHYFPLFAPISELVYRLVSKHRNWFFRSTGKPICTSSLPMIGGGE